MLQMLILEASLLTIGQCLSGHASIKHFHVKRSASWTPFTWPTTLTFDSLVTLRDGYTMPVEGFGTYRMAPGNETYASVRAALDLGYRMIDTAEMYGNEADVGRAIRDSGIPRSQVFVTTKITETAHGYSRTIRAGNISNQVLGLGYIDLLLMHSPHGQIVETYDAMLDLQAMGVVRSVGVSNFGETHLRALAEYCRPVPVVNQIEMHPLIYQERKDLADYCKDNDILITAYGSVLSGHDDLLELASSIADSHQKTSAQVFLRWALQEGFQVIPKSTHTTFIRENTELYDFSLSVTEVDNLIAINGSVGEYWNPINSPVLLGDVSHRAGCE